MRLLELGLAAFGPFTDTRLDFSREGALHLVYGPNEAGKSTALRAIGQLLYGIPVNTRDAHLHRMKDLRLTGRLEAADGERIELVRRKGRKNTLLDPAGEPLDEAALRPFLGGVSQEVFAALFGLDHVTLREGAEDLLAGRGSVGESLFGAGVGGKGIHRLLRELEGEAEALFKPRGKTPALNRALRAFAEADKRIRHDALRAEAWAEQERAIAEDRLELAALQERRRELAAERDRLRRALAVLPRLAQRRRELADRGELGDVVLLAPETPEERLNAARDLEESEREARRVRAELEALEARRARLVVPEALLELTEEAAGELQDRLGAYRRAAAELPQARAERAAAEEAVRAAARELGHEETPEDAEGLRLGVAARARLRELASRRSVLGAALAHAEKEEAGHGAALERQRARLAELAPAAGLEAAAEDLRRALTRARKAGDLERSVREAEVRLAAAERAAETARSGLRFWNGSLEDLLALPLPGQAAVERHAAGWNRAEREADDLGRRRREAEEETEQTRRDLAELRLQGSVPSEEELDGKRAARDGLWRRVRAAWEAGKAMPEETALAGDFEAALEQADHYADRLRREAARAARLATLKADRAAQERLEAALEAEAAKLDAARAEQETAWRAMWQPAGIEPGPPEEMLDWLRALPRLRDLAEAKRGAAAEVEALRTAAALHAAALHAALEAVEDGTARRSPSRRKKGSREALAILLERAETASESTSERLRANREATARQDELAAQLTAAAREREARAEALESWREDWAGQVALLGLGPDATPEEALAVLEAARELLARLEDLGRKRRRTEALEEERQRFEEDVEALTRRHLPESRGEAAERAADLLLRRAHEARHDRDTRERLAAEAEARRRELAEIEERRARAEARLRELLRAARAEDLDALEEAERRSGEARDLDRRLREVEEQLLEEGGGASLEELEEAARGLEAPAARVRLEEIDEELEETEEAGLDLRQRLGACEEGQRRLAERSATAAAAAAEEALAEVRRHAHRSLRLRLASLVLRREIERYREAHQGPVLERARQLFPRLTLGRYTRLEVGFGAGDEAVLLCVDGAGREKQVEALSDGTRDQLYLALRLASLARHAEHAEPLPLVLDDVLVHFDDERARAAMEVLGEVAAGTQVLFFTHHARLAELAREAVPEERLAEHALSPPALPVASGEQI